MNNLQRFYHGINQLLADKGVLPELNVDKERQNLTTRFMANRSESRSANNPPADEPTLDKLASALPSDGNVIQAQDLFSMLQQASGTAPTSPGGGGPVA